jgi:hypothetical protein
MFHRRSTQDAENILVGKPEVKISPRRPRFRWENNIKMNLKEIGCDCVDWIHLVQDRDQFRGLMKTVMNLRVP